MQGFLFETHREPLASGEQAAEQEKQLQRVKGKMAAAIRRFWNTLRPGDQFHSAQLHEFVKAEIPNSAPASAERILRDMRANIDELIDYECVNRRQSLYRKIR